MNRTWRSWVLDCVILLAISAFLIRPNWKLKYVENWGSIESTFIADARMLRDHWPQPLWQPFWYLGTRWDNVYPPALRYGTAALAKYYPMDPAKAYRLYTGFFYCFGIAMVYILARVGFRRRWGALAAGLMAAVVSPGYLFFPTVAADGFELGTTKLNALVRYGEGPHMTALAWLPLALALAWLGFDRASKSFAIASGFACAMVVANNFYGATALAMLYPFVVWAFWLRDRHWRIVGLALIPPAIAYGLSAFWFTPQYVALTLRNMQYVSETGNLWSRWVGLGVLVAYLSATNRLSRRGKLSPWAAFLSGAVCLFTLNTVGNYWLKFRIIGEPMRLVPELDILYIFLLVALGIWLWDRRTLAGKLAVSAALIAILAGHGNYLRRHRAIFPPATDYKPSLYYKIPAWIHENYPDSRSYVTGAVRFWFNTWHDLAQLGGSSEQGLQNQIVMPSQWEIVMGDDPKIAVPWLQALGVDLVATHGSKSREYYHDFTYPNKFEGMLKPVFDDGEENRIYEVPRRYRSLARVVDRKAYDALPPISSQADREGLERYVEVLERGPEAPTATRWNGTDALDIQAKVGPGQSLVVQVTQDSRWRAESNLGTLSTRADGLGFIRIDPPAGVEWVKLRFTKAPSKRAGEILFLLTLVASGWVLWKERKQKNG